MIANGPSLFPGQLKKAMRWSIAALILLSLFWSTMLYGAVSVGMDKLGYAFVPVIFTAVITAVVTAAVSGLIGAWITVHVLRERLSGIERWLKAVDSDVKLIRRDLYRPAIPGGPAVFQDPRSVAE